MKKILKASFLLQVHWNSAQPFAIMIINKKWIIKWYFSLDFIVFWLPQSNLMFVNFYLGV